MEDAAPPGSPERPDGWVGVAIDVTVADAELAADVLWSCGAAGVEEQDREGGLRFVGGFADAASADEAVAEAARRALAAELLTIDDDGLDAWRAWAIPQRAGRFWITPEWVDAPPTGPGEVVLWIEPGRTFGSGSHPTTRLTLQLLDGLVSAGDSVLDVGCGSGVLAVGAALLGASTVVAIDIDPDAPRTSDHNAARNGVGAAIGASNEDLRDVVASGRRFAVVAANLLAPTIAELAPDLVAAVAPGGVLVVSGLLEDRWESSMAALAPLEVTEVVADDGWVAVRLGGAGCPRTSFAPMAVTPDTEIVFTEDDLEPIAAVLAELEAAGAGWVNFVPEVEPGHDPPPRNPVIAIFSSNGDAVPLATWSAPANEGGRATLGVTHGSGPKALARLDRFGVPLEPGWLKVADHPRRGLVVTSPKGTEHDHLVWWLLTASHILSTVPLTETWLARVYRR